MLLGGYALWQLADMITPPHEYVLQGILISTSGVAAMVCFWFALRGHIPESRGDMRTGCLGGLLLGAVGFLGGLIIPLLFAPEANTGPLVGFLLTGPLGMITGTLLGIAFAKVRRRRKAALSE